jgi:heme o synthase
MAVEHILITGAQRSDHGHQPWTSRWLATVSDYWSLTKPEVNFLIVICSVAGFYLGCSVSSEDFPLLRLIHTLLGTLLVASGAATLNQYIERHYDGRMRRTAQRPLPASRISPGSSLMFGILLASTGTIYLAVAVNLLSSSLTLRSNGKHLFAHWWVPSRAPCLR